VTTLALVGVGPEQARLHAPVDEYDAYLEHWIADPVYRRMLRHTRDQFLACYADVEQWFAAPLLERVGRDRRDGIRFSQTTLSYRARPYLHYLGLRGYVWFDWEWLLAVAQHRIWELDERLALTLRRDVDACIDEAAQLGYVRSSVRQSIFWAVSRIVLHAGNPRVAAITDGQVDALVEAVRRFGERPDVALFHGSMARYARLAGKEHLTHIHALRVVLYHRGQAVAEPHRNHSPHGRRWQVHRPRMQALAERFLAARRLTDRPATIVHLELALRQFIAWLVETESALETFAQVTREHVLAYAEALEAMRNPRTGQPYATLTKRGRLAALAVFFRDVAAWRWEDAPSHPVVAAGDLPKLPQRVPRYVPVAELGRLMAAIRALTCPYQRAALLIARWCGARRDEIRRLPLECLDEYPDGTPRLHIPAGKTRRERLVPLHEEAAEAIRAIQRERPPERGFRDSLTGMVTRRLFVHHGKPFSVHYLFEAGLARACQEAGLVDAEGRPTVTAHRFRHTVGTQLAERGAKLHTIMQVLGHSSVSMSLVYAQISDQEVLRDYQAVLGPGATLAGPSAEAIQSGGLSAAAGRLAQEQLLQDRVGTGALSATAAGGAVRVRPLSDLRQVRHHAGVCASSARTTPR
jgi:integrase